MDIQFPSPNLLLFEPLNDKETLILWKTYKELYDKVCEFTEINATEINSIDSFAPWIDTWITQIPERKSTKLRILMIWNSEFISFACQQTIRRYLEQRSFRCRVWFHVEDPTPIQSAIKSRCIIKRIPTNIHSPMYRDLL